MSKHKAVTKRGIRPAFATIAAAAIILSSTTIGSAAFADEPATDPGSVAETPTEQTPPADITPDAPADTDPDAPADQPDPADPTVPDAPPADDQAPDVPADPADPGTDQPTEETPAEPADPTVPDAPEDDTPAEFGFTSTPTISGNLTVGSTLNLSPVALSGTPDSVAYQWVTTAEHFDEVIALVGATGTSLYLTSDLNDRSLAVKVTATKGDRSVSTITAFTGYVTGAGAPETVELTQLTPATITGTAKVGETLTVNPGTWSDPNVLFTYDWFVSYPSAGDTLGVNGTSAVVPDYAAGGRVGVKITANLGFQHKEIQVLTEVIPGTAVIPTTPAAPFPTDAGLTEANQGGVKGSTAGLQAYLTFPNGKVGQIVYVYGYSTPVFLGAYTLDANLQALVDFSALPAGDHRLVGVAADGTVLGWYGVTVPSVVEGLPGTPSEPNAAAPAGTNAGSAASGAAGSSVKAEELGATGGGDNSGTAGIAGLILLAGLVMVVFRRVNRRNVTA